MKNYKNGKTLIELREENKKRPFSKKIVIFGFGADGREFFRYLLRCIKKENIFAIIDNYYSNDKKAIEGVPIYTLEEYMKYHDDTDIVISSSRYYSDMEEMLYANGVEHFYSVSEYKEKARNNYINWIDTAVEAYDLDNLDLFLKIDIETINRCNGTCPFCPVNATERQRPYAKMSKELFEKIVDDLVSINYKHSISLYCNNEPFLDERIVEFHKYLKEKLPNVVCELMTNGTLLTLDKFLDIIPYLDKLAIDNYSDDMVMGDNAKTIIEYVENKPELKEKVIVHMRKQNEVLFSRGGTAPNKKEQNCFIGTKCVLPFQQFIIRPDGKVSLCCNDALGGYTLGDLNVQTIEEVWYSKEYMEIRKEMKTNGRKNLKLCNNCDTIGGVIS